MCLVGVSKLKFGTLKSSTNFISNKRKPLINKLNSIFIGCNTEPIKGKNQEIKPKSQKNHLSLFALARKKGLPDERLLAIKTLQLLALR